MQPRTFVTDSAWQRQQHARLLEMAGNASTASRVLETFDMQPALREQLWDVYCAARNTLGLNPRNHSVH